MIGTTINDRYQIIEEIGKGGMGTVYRTTDETLKREVALKLLSTTRLGTEGRARMLREAQTVARLNHPNIVTVFDAGELDETPYIVMELITGQTLGEANPSDLDEIVELAHQICAALTHAHDQGVIHRDLKPENIIIQPDGVLKLMDFGLARSVASRMTEEGTIMGTVHYMAPEQAQGKDVDHRTDLYSLGVLLYEFTTGSLPFEAEHPVAIITQHISAPVVPPRAKNDQIPYYLDHLIQKLLEKEPDDRPQSANEVIAALDAKAEPSKTEEEELSVLDRISRGRIIGRKAEIQEAHRVWNKASHGKGDLLLVTGEPGIGKSRFTKEIITNTEVSGGLALVGASYAEGGMPYSAFRQVLRKGLRSTAGKSLDIPHEILTDLLTLAPELRSSYPDLKAVINNDLPDPQQLWEHFVIFINMLSVVTPVLLVIEDIHWSDSGSLSLARHLARHTRENAVLLLYNYREVEIHENRAFHDMLLDFNRERIGSRIKLTRLDKAQTREMLEALFNESITDEFLNGIFRETEGHPFYIEEVIKALVESGRLYYKDGTWHRPSIEELGIPQSVHVAIQSRLDLLPSEAHDLLRQAAIFGREFDFKYLQQASTLDELDLIDTLELAESAQIIEEIESETSDARFAFVHALIPTTLIEDTRTLKRRVLHRRAAEVIEEHDPANLQALAFHFTEAGEIEKAVGYHLELADNARKMLATQEAIGSYLQALDFLRETKDLDKTRDVLYKLALSYQDNFEFDASQEIYEEAFALQKKFEVKTQDLPLAPHPLRLGIPPVTSFDPALAKDVSSAFAIHLLTTGLAKTQLGGTVIPHMAKRWEVKDEGLRYVFHLHPNLQWSDGEPITAHTFEYSWKRTLNPELKSETAVLLYVIKNAKAYHSGELKNADSVGIRALDDLTFEVTLEQPTGYFIKLVDYSNTFAQPRHIIEKYGADWTKPENIVACGPFTLVSWDQYKKTALKRNPLYFKPFTGNLEYCEYIHDIDAENPNPTFANNEVDVIGIGTEDARQIARRTFAEDIRTGSSHLVRYTTFNCAEPPFDNLLARRALATATNKDHLIGNVMNLPDRPAHGGLLPPSIAGHSAGIGYKFDPVQARRLLADAGYPNGEGFPPIHFKYGPGNLNFKISEYISETWAEILNIEVSCSETSFQELMDIASLNPTREVRYPILLMGWYMDYPDPHNMLAESTWVTGSGWKNEQYDQLIAQAIKMDDQQGRLRLYQQADQLVIDQCVVMPFSYGFNEWLMKPWVKNLHPDPDTIFSDISNVVIEPHD